MEVRRSSSNVAARFGMSVLETTGNVTREAGQAKHQNGSDPG